MDQTFKVKIAVASLAAALVAVIVVIAVTSGGSGGDGSDSSSFVTFLPIWIAIFVPIFAARQQREREKAKRQFRTEGEDIYSMMNRLVDDLNEDETDYLKRRLRDKFDDSLHE